MIDLVLEAQKQWPNRPIQIHPAGSAMVLDVRSVQILQTPLSQATHAQVDRHWPGQSPAENNQWFLLEPLDQEHSGGLVGLVQIVDRLLGPGGCPWDQAQTHESLRPYLIEEAYEVLDAIDRGDVDKLEEELGDLLLQPILHAQIEAQAGSWDSYAVAERICAKLIRRHPHVFGETKAETPDEVLANWDAIKQTEKKKEEPKGILAGVPRALPALHRAHQISVRAARVGFEWGNLDDVLAKLEEERQELVEAIGAGNKQRIGEEIGDLLFTVVNIARWCDVLPEDVLREMVDRFTARFEAMERAAPKPLRELTAREWDDLWNQAKANA